MTSNLSPKEQARAALREEIERGHELTRYIIAQHEEADSLERAQKKADRKAFHRKWTIAWFLVIMSCTFWLTFCHGVNKVPLY